MLQARFMRGSAANPHSPKRQIPVTDEVNLPRHRARSSGAPRPPLHLSTTPSFGFHLHFMPPLRLYAFRLSHTLACAGLREPLAFRRLSPRNLRRTAVAFELMTLPYAYDALEPYMSAETLHYHHDKHHQAYVDTLNKLL